MFTPPFPESRQTLNKLADSVAEMPEVAVIRPEDPALAAGSLELGIEGSGSYMFQTEANTKVGCSHYLSGSRDELLELSFGFFRSAVSAKLFCINISCGSLGVICVSACAKVSCCFFSFSDACVGLQLLSVNDVHSMLLCFCVSFL